MKSTSILSALTFGLALSFTNSAQAITFSQIKPVLNKCEACHTDYEVNAPYLNVQPFGSNETHVSWVAKILERLNRPEGARGRMPKNAGEWDQREIQALRIWLMQGAPNDAGQPTAPVLLKPQTNRAPQSLRSSLRHDISFTQNWSRYPSPDSILATLVAQFPKAKLTHVEESCKVINEENQTLLGSSNPVTGEATIRDPNASFLVWYAKCVAAFVKSESIGSTGTLLPTAENTHEFWSPETFAMCKGSGQLCDFSKLSLDQRIAVTSAEIERLLGPDEVIRESGLAESLTALARRVEAQLTETWSTRPQAFAVIGISASSSSGGALAMRDAVLAIRFLTLLNDTLKY